VKCWSRARQPSHDWPVRSPTRPDQQPKRSALRIFIDPTLNPSIPVDPTWNLGKPRAVLGQHGFLVAASLHLFLLGTTVQDPEHIASSDDFAHFLDCPRLLVPRVSNPAICEQFLSLRSPRIPIRTPLFARSFIPKAVRAVQHFDLETLPSSPIFPERRKSSALKPRSHRELIAAAIHQVRSQFALSSLPLSLFPDLVGAHTPATPLRSSLTLVAVPFCSGENP
jgi:hypothetical protein